MIQDSSYTPNPLSTKKNIFHGIFHTRIRLTRGRLRCFIGLISLSFFALYVRIIDLSVLGPDCLTAPIKNISPLYAPQRGSIYDREGCLLALSIPNQAAYIRKNKMIYSPDILAEKIAHVLKKRSVHKIYQALTNDTPFIWLSRHLTPQQWEGLIRIGEPGIGFEQREQRVYPQGKLTSHVVGTVNLDNKGISGLEQKFHDRLEGKNNICVSIDLRCQQVLYQELGHAMEKYRAKAANGLVLKLDTDEIIASVSLPCFTPHIKQKSEDQSHFNRNTLGVYELGSILKIVNTAMALETGAASTQTLFNTVDPIKVGRFCIRDYRPTDHWMAVDEIFIKSSNIGSARIAQTVGSQKQKIFFQHLGMFAPPRIEVPEVGRPLIPKKWNDVNTMVMSYGYGISLSPLHFATVIGSIVNGGRLVQPTFLKTENSAQGAYLISAQTSQTMRHLMRRCVLEGTSRQANVPHYVVAGKTGTANLRQGRRYIQGQNMNSFVGTLGSHIDQPEYLILVMLEAPQGLKETFGLNAAGWNAAPTSRRIIEKIAPILGVLPKSIVAKKQGLSEHYPKDTFKFYAEKSTPVHIVPALFGKK